MKRHRLTITKLEAEALSMACNYVFAGGDEDIEAVMGDDERLVTALRNVTGRIDKIVYAEDNPVAKGAKT